MSALEAQDWLRAAQADLAAVRSLTRDQNFLPACFHAHQAVEKSLKAYLVAQDILFPKSHNLSELLKLCQERQPGFTVFTTAARWLNGFYLPARYPDELADLGSERLGREEAERAGKAAAEMYEFTRKQVPFGERT